MQIKFTINSPPFSINKAYYRNRKRTQECRKWGDKILLQLQDPSIQLKFASFKAALPEHPHLRLKAKFRIPKERFYTKKGGISRRSMDLSNVEKLLIDLIFDERYNDRKLREIELSNLNLDDKLIVELYSSKESGDSYAIEITLESL